MVKAYIKYPIGIQTFEDIINEGYLYIDKTKYVYEMTRKKYIFLSRPRRFGKSLLVSTLRSYFEGKKELFKGLEIEKLEKDWKAYPIIRFDMSGGKHLDKEGLIRYLRDMLNDNAKDLGVTIDSEDVNIAFKQLIKGAREKHDKKVVALIDEYDAPLLDVIHKDQQLEELRETMRNFYAPIKKCDEFLHFVFITGITKFSQLSIFSELNNLDNISMMEKYAGVCGITEEEMLTQMNDGIEALAEKQGISKEDAIKALKENYDGYHFSWPSPDVYNPFSLLNALDDSTIKGYWFSTGTPTSLINVLRKFHVTPSRLGTQHKAKDSSFDAPTENMTSVIPLLYQSGYTTIKDCSPTGLYTLDIPNREIRIGLMESLLPNYLTIPAVYFDETLDTMQNALFDEDIDLVFESLKTFLGTIPQADNVEQPEHFEAHWQQLFYVIFSLLGTRCDVEVKTSTGRVDFVARTANTLYLVELKMNEDAEKAMEQIDLKQYGKRFALCGLPIVKVGVSFREKERNITGWKIEK